MSGNIIRVGIIVALVGLTGCGEEKPTYTLDTIPVKGRVVDASGQPVPAGTIEFISAEDPERSASGEIVNGDFTISTNYHGTKLDGAAAGTYSVMVIPPMSGSQSETPVELPERVSIEDSAPLQLQLPAGP